MLISKAIVIVVILCFLIPIQLSAQSVDSVRADTLGKNSTLSEKKLLLEKLDRALSNDSRRVFLLSKDYEEIGSILSYKDNNFILRSDSSRIPFDAVAGLTETPRTYSGVGALIGGVSVATAFVVSLASRHETADSTVNKGGNGGEGFALGVSFIIVLSGAGAGFGAVVGGYIQRESINFPIYKIR